MKIEEGFWVFGYGSLMWNPGIEVAERRVARMNGWHRSFCMRSVHHRGTYEDPGLVLALDRAQDEFCDGVAFRIDAKHAGPAIVELRERELVSSAYLEEVHDITFRCGQSVPAVTYVIDRDHDQYVAGMPLEEQARIIAEAIGGRGPNDEYLYNTACHLAELGLADDQMDWLVARVKALKSL